MSMHAQRVVWPNTLRGLAAKAVKPTRCKVMTEASYGGGSNANKGRDDGLLQRLRW